MLHHNDIHNENIYGTFHVNNNGRQTPFTISVLIFLIFLAKLRTLATGPEERINACTTFVLSVSFGLLSEAVFPAFFVNTA